MKELTEWWREIGGAQRQWLLLGKGPSFEVRDRYDLRPYTTLAINHTVREMPVEVASAVNFEVVQDCGDAVYRNSRFLLMPRYPHTIPGEGPALLETYFDSIPVLRAMDEEGRLVWYNLSGDPALPGSPVVKNSAFSVGILFSLLGALGARQIRTLGVDGGVAYAASFKDIEARTRLATGKASYDFQFTDMMWAVRHYGLDYAPLQLPTVSQKLRMYLTTPAPRRALRRWLWRGSLPRFLRKSDFEKR